MRLSPTRSTEEPEISLTSLIDVVFILIIFFVVTTTFEERSAIEIELPEASAEVQPEPGQPLLVVVGRDGRYVVGGNEVQGDSAADLRAAIERVAGEDRDRTVIVRADARATHQSVVTAQDVLGQLGFRRQRIATTPATDPAE